MPELPEVEHAANRLRSVALGQIIAAANTFHPAQTRQFPRSDGRKLAGRRITTITRRAKIQLITFDDDHVLEVHFRMNGDWEFWTDRDEPPRFERFRLTCANGARISLVDSRALAVIKLHAPGALILPDLGPEPLSDEFTVAGLADALSRRRTSIKQALLDQRVVAGIGNIYAAESLWEARIHPTTSAHSLARVRLTRLVHAIRVVLQRAQGQRYHSLEASVNDPVEFLVYDREDEPCMRSDGGIIRRVVQGGRSTYYCPRCQR